MIAASYLATVADISSGGPGVGKGTQCTRLANDLDLVHISVGDLLRAEAEKPATQNTVDIKRHMQNGTLVPTWFVQEVLEKSIIDNVKNGKYRFLVDGFPRSWDQCLHFTHHVSLKQTHLCTCTVELTNHEGLHDQGYIALSML